MIPDTNTVKAFQAPMPSPGRPSRNRKMIPDTNTVNAFQAPAFDVWNR